MSAEFTGERVIPGQVDADLWNEHISRYAFAARLARRKRVLDVGCGMGYGSAELAETAAEVSGIDISDEAITGAAERYFRPNLRFQTASATALPFPDDTFDLVVAFEVIEHLTDWDRLLTEAARVLKPGGQLVVSTPNKSYYAETRAQTGPNPFHEHEFEFEEFRDALAKHFPYAILFTQNHTDAIVFTPIPAAAASDVKLDAGGAKPAEAHFYVAVCATEPLTGAPAFLYVPSTANVLRERESHINKLEGYLKKALTDLETLTTAHQQQEKDLRVANDWSKKLNAEIEAAGKRIVALQEELAGEQKRFQSELARVEAENQETIAGFRKQLTETEEMLEDRTRWAKSLDAESEMLRSVVNTMRGSTYVRIGKLLGLVPREK